MRKRRDRFTRDPKRSPAPEIQARDVEIFRRLHERRFLRTTHIVRLVSAEHSGQCVTRRLERLFDHGYVDRPRAKKREHLNGSNKPMVHALGNRGAQELYRRGLIRKNAGRWTEKNREVGEAFIDHELLTADVLTAIETACRKDNSLRFIPHDEILARASWEMQEKQKPLQLGAAVKYRGKTISQRTMPDGMFGIEFLEDGNEAFFFLEADRGTMPQYRSDTLQSFIFKKFLLYYGWWQKQGHERELGIENFRVLFVADTPQRSQNMLVASQPIREDGGWRGFLFADKETLLTHPNILEAPWRNGKGEITNLLE